MKVDYEIKFKCSDRLGWHSIPAGWFRGWLKLEHFHLFTAWQKLKAGMVLSGKYNFYRLKFEA